MWGAGLEIRSFGAQLARRLPGARIAVAAFDAPPDGDVLAALHAPDARVVADGDVLAALGGCDVVVRSPGVSSHRPELRALSQSGVPVTTATALWLAERAGRGVIGVTGTKGKSTTAALALHLARAAGRDVELAGNIGAPALDLLDREPLQNAVVELSSYQIADLQSGPEVVVFTNLYREHVDWHGSELLYRADKLRILDLPGVRAIVLNGREQTLRAAAEAHPEAALYGVPPGWDAPGGDIVHGGRQIAAGAELPLRGEHNALNLCAALAGLEAAGIVAPELPAALDGFRPLAHRLEVVAERDGVLWVNDSISTTPESALAALASFAERAIVLIGGGQDRGQDYTALARELAARGASVIGLPSTGPRLLAAARSAGAAPSRVLEAPDLAGAVALARELASPGSVVLLSPAAPSYDNYSDFEERGERFRALAASA